MRVELAGNGFLAWARRWGVNALATMCKLIGWLHHQNKKKNKMNEESEYHMRNSPRNAYYNMRALCRPHKYATILKILSLPTKSIFCLIYVLQKSLHFNFDFNLTTWINNWTNKLKNLRAQQDLSLSIFSLWVITIFLVCSLPAGLMDLWQAWRCMKTMMGWKRRGGGKLKSGKGNWHKSPGLKRQQKKQIKNN